MGNFFDRQYIQRRFRENIVRARLLKKSQSLLALFAAHAPAVRVVRVVRDGHEEPEGTPDGGL